MRSQLSFSALLEESDQPEPSFGEIETDLSAFRQFGTSTSVARTAARCDGGIALAVPTYVNEFWTSKQRAANSLHEVSYRACFKPQLPRFFIERLTTIGEYVYDPFMGRGTTLLEAALLGRVPFGCDVNPLSAILLSPRFEPPTLQKVAERLAEIDFDHGEQYPEELLVFYHPQTLTAICGLRQYLLDRAAAGALDAVDRWVRMVAITRLTGHSPGFFSVYTLPPNQAVSVERQKLINERRHQVPPYRSVPDLILAKSRSLLADCDEPVVPRLRAAAEHALILTQPSRATPEIASETVSLVVTSPPFLDIVDYAGDNWLRCWFCGIDPSDVPLTILRRLEDWQEAMIAVFKELERVLKPGGHVAFEVGEIRSGTLRLEEAVIPCGAAAGLTARLVLINQQDFTKTANCWGVKNGTKGTNTNRIVLFQKRAAGCHPRWKRTHSRSD